MPGVVGEVSGSVCLGTGLGYFVEVWSSEARTIPACMPNSARTWSGPGGVSTTAIFLLLYATQFTPGTLILHAALCKSQSTELLGVGMPKIMVTT